MRGAPPAAASAVRPGFVHEALIYRSDDELLEVAVPFLHESADAGQPAFAAVNARQQRALLHELGDVPGITQLDPDHYRDPLSALRHTYRLFARLTRGGARRIHIVGEVPHDPWPAWLRYEAAVNDLFAPFPVCGVCLHDARTTPDDVLADVERTHPYLALPGDHVVASPFYEQPAALLAERARAEADPLERRPPDLLLEDPPAETARAAMGALAARTRLDRDNIDALRLSVGHVVINALVHGRPPVSMRAWAARDRVVVKVTDAGSGPADPYVGMLPRNPEADPEDANALHLVTRALSDVSLFTDVDGFTVRLVERRAP